MGQIQGATYKSEAIFTLEANIKPILDVCCSFASDKVTYAP